MSVSANMTISNNDRVDSQQLGFHISKSLDDSMYLGQWRDQISSKLNPRYFSRLVNKRLTKNVSSQLLDSSYLPNFSNNNSLFVVPVFTDNAFTFLRDGNINFSFASDSVRFEPSMLKSSIKSFNSTLNSKYSKPTLLEQEYYTPGYVISNENSSFGVAAILVQQSFLDDSLGSTTVASSSSNFIYSLKEQRKVNRGIGYQFNFTQKLFNEVYLSIDHQSQINMNEFDAFGSTYSDQGDFDLPSQYAVSLGLPVLGSKVNFSAERIAYSNVESNVHSGFSEAFLNVYNGIFNPIYELQDLTVYSVSIEQSVNENFSWNAELASRQQAHATSEIYDRILTQDTASVSYKLGMTYTAPIGQVNFYASFANKSLFIGATDFGRFSNSTSTQHIEGVASWSFQF